MVRVVIADDHPLFTFGVKQWLTACGNVEVLGEAADFAEIREMLQTMEIDILITDLVMPSKRGPDGLAMLSAIRARWPQMKVIVLTTLENIGILASVRDFGVNGILNKCDDICELPAAVGAVSRGGYYFGQAVARRMAQMGPVTKPRNIQAKLSPRELEVVRLYAGGMTMNEIARHLCRAANTISTQKCNAMRKLGISNDADLFHYAMEHGIR